MSTNHQAYVLGEGVDQVEESRTRVGVTGHHQTLGSAVKHVQEKTASVGVFLSSDFALIFTAFTSAATVTADLQSGL